MPQSVPKFVVVGAGAVGGVVGGLLHRAGYAVTLVARGAHLAAIRSSGLQLQTSQGDTVERITTVGSVAEVDWSVGENGVIVVLLAVKSDGTAALAAELALAAPPDVRVVCLQNGVANEPTALRWFSRVYGVCVMAPTSHLEPGVVRADSGPVAAVLDIGRYPGAVGDQQVDPDPDASMIAAAFTGAGMVSEPRANIMAWKYRKLIANLGNAVDAICERGEAATALMRLLREEGEATLAAAGIEVTPTAVDADRRGDLLQSYDRPGEARGGGSTWQSLARGTGSVETDYLNGEIVLVGRQTGVPTPANELVCRATRQRVAEGAAPRSLPAEQLMDEFVRIPDPWNDRDTAPGEAWVHPAFRDRPPQTISHR